MPAAKVKEVASKMGFSRTTLQRAKKHLGIKASKAGFDEGWVWVDPERRMKNLRRLHIPGTRNLRAKTAYKLLILSKIPRRYQKHGIFGVIPLWKGHEDSKGRNLRTEIRLTRV